MWFAVFPLFVVGEESVLQLSAFGFGVLMTATAAGAAAASLVVGRVVEAVGRAPVLWASLVVFAAVPALISVTGVVWLVGALLLVSGVAIVSWNVVTVSLRQSIIPDALLGRVNSAYRFVGWGAIPIGALLGGLLADAFGLRAAFVGGAALAVVSLPLALGTVTGERITQARDGAQG